jgi:hypothetical protein
MIYFMHRKTRAILGLLVIILYCILFHKAMHRVGVASTNRTDNRHAGDNGYNTAREDYSDSGFWAYARTKFSAPGPISWKPPGLSQNTYR